jgi:primosomal protein N' (replication factor Y)
MRYPPYAAMANVVVRAEKQEDAMRYSAEFGRLMTPPPQGIKALGPAEAPVSRLKAEYRYQLLLKAAKRSVLREALLQLRSYAAKEKWPTTAVVIDVDPLSLM